MAIEAPPGNGVSTTLSSAITSTSATTCVLTSAAAFTNAQYHCLITDGTNYEIVEATGLSGSTLTIVRSAELWNGASTAFTFAVGSSVTIVTSLQSVLNLMAAAPIVNATSSSAAPSMSSADGLLVVTKSGGGVGDALQIKDSGTSDAKSLRMDAANNLQIMSNAFTPIFVVADSGVLTAYGALAMGSNKITGLTNGSGAQDAAAFGQVPVPANGYGITGNTGATPTPAVGLTNQSSFIGSPVTLTAATPSNVTSLSLAAGTWLLMGQAAIDNTTAATNAVGTLGIGTTTASFTGALTGAEIILGGATAGTAHFASLACSCGVVV